MNDKDAKGKVKRAQGNDKHAPENVKHSKTHDKHAQAHEKVARAHEKLSGLYLHTALPGGKGIHIGYTIGRLLQKLQVSTATLAALLHIAPQNARAMLKKKYLHASTLVKISEALKHDVIRYLYLPGDLPGNKKLKERVEELEQENVALREKVEMLEELNALLKGKK